MSEPLFKLVHIGDLMKNPSPPESGESSYRRGYTQGYSQALDDMYGLLSGGRHAKFSRPREALNMLSHFLSSQLLRWRSRKEGFCPPRFKWEHSWAEIRSRIFERDGHKCVYCGDTSQLECDHITRVSDGGRPIWLNLRTLCKDCHANIGNWEYIDKKNFEAIQRGADCLPWELWYPTDENGNP